jgi:NAD(P)-dependent dehydrogenase (short-subunit alcohol dehydrogenase family)
MDLKNKIIAITGVSEGLGRVLCREYLNNGAKVFACARNIDKFSIDFENEIGKNLLVIKADVSNEIEISNFFELGTNFFGDLDVLVNNAGIYGPKGSIDEIDITDWKYCIDVNLIGSVNAVRHSLPIMKKNKKGKIIQLSGGGATNPMPNLTAYAVSKAAIVRFVETVALEVKQYNIFINAIAPGPLNTRLLDEIIESGPEKVGQEFFNKSLKQRDNGGVSMQNAVDLCLFLSSTSSAGISGKLISAIWDKWQDWDQHLDDLNNSDIYCLRRITGKDRGFDWGDK